MVITSPLPSLNRAALVSRQSSPAGALRVPGPALFDLPERIVQFGTGGFLRGFLDDFVHRANERGLFDGRIVAVGSTGSTRDAVLRDQDGLYTLVVEGVDKGDAVQECRIIASLSRTLSAKDEWPEVLALAHSPSLGFVFSNTTEVGIAIDPDDRAEDAPPKSFPAKLTRFLLERARTFQYDRARGLVVVPCELIEQNGDRLRELTLALAERWQTGAPFNRWLAESVSFCNTLVDRIVPGVPRGDHARRLANMLGYQDVLLTTCEPYRLFAIEGDEQLRERLPWTRVDPAIIIASDIAPYRERKVRLLNGAHTLIVSAALAMGCATVREAVTHPVLGRFLEKAMFDEIVVTLHADGAKEFAVAVLQRFQNPFIHHALLDITLQNTMKWRVRLVPSIVAFAARAGEPPASLAFGFAAFLSFMHNCAAVQPVDATPAVSHDDRASYLESHWSDISAEDGSAFDGLVVTICADESLWGADLAAIPGFAALVARQLTRIRVNGITAALEEHLGLPVS